MWRMDSLTRQGHIVAPPAPILVSRLIGIFKSFATLARQMAFCFIIVHGY